MIPNWQILEVIEEIKEHGILVTPKKAIFLIKEDEPDNRILECAIEGGAQYIVSGDKHHLLPLKEFRGIKILSPVEFLKILKSK